MLIRPTFSKRRKSGKKTFPAVMLIFCLLFPFLGTFTSLKYQKYRVKKEIKRSMINGMDRSELVLLRIPANGIETLLRWEHSREFCYEGEMYDVVEKELQGDTMLYWCWWDHEETELNKSLGNLVEYAFGHDPVRQREKNRFMDLFKVFHLYHSLEWNSAFQDSASSHSVYRSIIYFPPGLTSPSPPPEYC